MASPDEDDAALAVGTAVLPAPDRRAWLLDALRELLRRTEWEHFVCSPIVLPRPEYFPDRWTESAAGAHRLLRRLFCFADLEELAPHVELFDDGRPPRQYGETHSVHHKGTAGLFLGIAGGVAYFGAAAELLADPGGITATLAHEVAHAYRAHHGLCVDELDVEEQLTDLTTIFLGFGILSANAALRHRSGFGDEGIFSHQWSVQRLGYLSPQELCFVLAAQAHVRGPARAPVRSIADHLEPNQASFFRAALRWFARERPGLAAELGLPPPDAWPPPDGLAHLTRPLADDPAGPADADDPPRPPAPLPNAGRPVFRVWRRERGETFPLDLVLVIAAALALATGVAFAVQLGVTAAAGLGLALSVRRLRPRCSDPACRTPLARAAATCPGCGGTVAGDLNHASERLAAEEALSRRPGPRGP